MVYEILKYYLIYKLNIFYQVILVYFMKYSTVRSVDWGPNKMADAHGSFIYYIFYSLLGNDLSPSDKIDLIHDTNFILRSKIICLK